jgi:hypothetical protein
VNQIPPLDTLGFRGDPLSHYKRATILCHVTWRGNKRSISCHFLERLRKITKYIRAVILPPDFPKQKPLRYRYKPLRYSHKFTIQIFATTFRYRKFPFHSEMSNFNLNAESSAFLLQPGTTQKVLRRLCDLSITFFIEDIDLPL